MALENEKQIEELADRLTKCADSIHDRLMAGIKANEIDSTTARLIFNDESIIRQHANSLYIDAANCIVDNLRETQKNVISVVDSAKEKIKTIKDVATLIDLTADLLVLAAAAYAAKPDAILAALIEIKNDIQALENNDT